MVDIGAEDFYDIIEELGQKITFENNGQKIFAELPEGQGIEQYASIVPNRANKAIGTAEGAYLFTGNMTFDSREQQDRLRGCYFKFNEMPINKFFLLSTFFENSTEKVAIVNCVECNEKIDIISYYKDTGEVDEFGEHIYEPVYLAKDVDSYITMFNKEARDVPTGAMISTVGYLMLPAWITVSASNTIMKKSFVFNEKTKQNEFKAIPYKIESIDTGLMDEKDGELIGAVKVMLTEEN